MTSSPLADMLTRVRNALAVGRPEAVMPSSKLKVEIARILKEHNYINNYEVVDDPNIKNAKLLKVVLRYVEPKKPAIHDVKLVSKPGRRIYSDKTNLPIVLNHLGIAIISTSQGLMSNKEAQKKRLGGEVICEIY